MTREEIMQLNTDYLNGCESEHKMNELFSYALSQEPCDDVVSREAVINIVKLRWDYYKNCIEAIEKLPSVRPQEQTGHWINMEISINGDMSAECDKCGCIVRNSFTNNAINYCPNCGAKMVEPHESEEVYAESNN